MQPTVTRYIFRCTGCNVTEARDITSNYVVIDGKDTMIQDIRCAKCRRRFGKVDGVRGRFSAVHECGAKCMNAVGPACDCSCKGLNHGGGYLV